MKYQPLVSILINNYNYAHYLSDAIDSAIEQTYENIEIIVVDDGSTDNSQEVINSYGSQVIKVLKSNGRQASALNAGFSVSKGEIICLLDADDLFLPEKVSEVVNLFKLDSGINWIFTESAPIKTEKLVNTERSDLYKNIFDKKSNEPTRVIDFRAELKNAKLPNFTPSTSNLCFSKAFLEKIFPLPECKGSSGIAICDTYLNLLAVGLGKGCVTTKNLGIFRVHCNNLYSTQTAERKRELYTEIRVTTAYWMRINFPEFNKLSKKLFSQGFSTYLTNKNIIEDCRKLIEGYFSILSFQEKIEVRFMSFLYFLKSYFSKLT